MPVGVQKRHKKGTSAVPCKFSPKWLVEESEAPKTSGFGEDGLHHVGGPQLKEWDKVVPVYEFGVYHRVEVCVNLPR